MAANDNFRSSLHGFNRTDVVQFIQQQTSNHEMALRSLKEENSRLQAALNEARAENERLAAEKEALALEVEAVRLAMLEVKEEPVVVEEEPAPVEEAAPVLDEPIAPIETVVTPSSHELSELELAAYRRAEMTERMARERAAASANRMKMIFAQADEKLAVSAQDIATAFDTLCKDYEMMQNVLASVQAVVTESSNGLKAAEDICGEI